MKETEVQFIDQKLKDSFEKLKDPYLEKFLKRAFSDIEENPFCGIQIPKKRIPESYKKKYGVRNAWKYNLPGAWRLIYSIEGGKTVIVAIVLEWMDHKEYEKRFGYK